MRPDMIEHLQMLVLTVVFNPLFLGLLVIIHIIGRVLGNFMPWDNIVKPMTILFVVGLVIKLFIFTSGYDLYFMFGIPFIAGVCGGSKK